MDQPVFKVAEKSYIGDRIIEAGQEVATNSDIRPGAHMEPVNQAAKATFRGPRKYFGGWRPEEPVDLVSAGHANPETADPKHTQGD